MRVTNSMTVNTMLLNINRNMERLGKLQYQSATGNKIQYPSDNPIIAARALKFRTNVVETEQYLENVKQAKSWMDSAESAVINITDILDYMKELNVQAANGTLTIDDKQKITSQLSELTSQLTTEINSQYAGRYLFSGFRTDEPVLFTTEMPDKVFDITQELTRANIEDTVIYQKDPNDITKVIDKKEISKIQLAYDKIDNGTLNVSNLPAGYTVETKNSLDTDAYDVPDKTIHFIEDTGELIVPKDFYIDLSTNSFEVTYTKTGFEKNDINPVNYFTCTQHMPDGSTKDYDQSNQSLEFEFGTNTKMQINNLGKDILTVGLLNDLKDIVNFASSIRTTDEKDLRDALSKLGYSESEIEEEVKKHLSDEKKIIQNEMHEKFSALLTKMDNHKTQISKEQTVLGVKINRLEFIENRLTDDRLNFTELRDNNELVDLPETLINYNAQLAIYQSSLSIGANIIQKSLADFVR